MKIVDLMATDVATCAPHDSLNRAAQIMWERRYGSVLVLDEGGGLAGVVTDRDICMAAYTQGRRLDDIPVTTAMSHPVRTCLATANAEEAETLMMAYGIRRLAVVDAQGRLVGLVSLDDIARHAAIWDGKGDIDVERVAVALGEISRRTTTSDDDVPPDVGTDLAEIVRNSRAALETLREEIGADLELAGEELQKRWTRLEALVRAAEIRVREKSHAGARHLAELVTHAHQFRRRLDNRPRHRSNRGPNA